MFFKEKNIKGDNLYTTGVNDFGLKADYNWRVAKYYTARFGGGISGNWFVPGKISNTVVEDRKKIDETIGSQNQISALNTYMYIENEYITLTEPQK